jgi:uncharacterized protein
LWMLRKALGHPRKGPARPQDLVACSHCGLHLPRDEAVWRNARAYCCSQHAKDAPADMTGHDDPM